jgi:hypothetical protein
LGTSIAKEPVKKSRNKSKYISLLYDFVRHSNTSFIEDSDIIADLQHSSKCTAHSKLCSLSSGEYGQAFKLESKDGDAVVVKLPLQNHGFDVVEMELNMQAYKSAKQFKVNPIAEALGYWRSPTLQKLVGKQNYAFLYKYEDSFSTYAELIRNTVISKEDFKSLVFQMCVVLHILQTKMPGFCHNDLHGYNILIVKHSEAFTYDGATHKGSYCIKILDFGMSETREKYTKDARNLWSKTRYNAFVDFLMFCNRTLIYASAHAKKQGKYPVWLAEFLRFLERHFHPQCIMNGSGTGAWLNYKYLHVEHSEGIKYITSKPKSLHYILTDSYFD